MKAKFYLLTLLVNLFFLNAYSGTTLQTITFTSIPAKLTTSPAFTLSAVAQSGLPVSFTVTSGGTIASVSGSTVTLSGLAGTVTIQATQAGDVNFAAATPVSKTFVVTKSTQTITFATIPTKYMNSADFALGATASSGLPVSYAITGPATLTGSTVHITGTGTVSIVASQAGNATYNAASNVTKSFIVSKASQTITFATITNKLINAADFTLAATASSGLAVSYTITGPATLTGTTVHLLGTTGTVSIVASQAGNTIYNAATNITRTFTVSNLGTQTITFATIANKFVNSADFTLAATASSGLAVSYAITGPATLTGSTVHLTGTVGTVSITASQAGNTSFTAAASVTKTFTVSKVSQTITFATLGNLLINAADFTLAATSSSGLTVSYAITGPATLTGTTVHLLGTAGTVSITASQAGNATYAAATNVVRSFTVSNLTSQAITFASIAGKYVNSADFTLAATASSGLTVSYAVTGPATITGTTVHLTGTAGTVSITASQAGNTTYAAATSVTRTFTVSKVSQTITFATIANKLVNAADFTIAATASSALTVSYAITGPATLTGTTVHLTGATGTVSITASQAGNATYAAAANVVRTFTVSNLTAQTITFANIASKFVNSADFTLAATASSGLAVSYAITGPATLSGSTVHITGAGTVSITASQAGNTTYAAATSVVRSFVVSKLTQTISWTAIAGMYNTAADFSVSATASSGLTCTYSVVSGPATISGSTVHLTGVVGNVTLRATQAGDATYASKTQDILFTVSDDPAVRMSAPEIETAKISFYPNPSANYIHLTNLTEDAKISVIDQRGDLKLSDNISMGESLDKAIDLSTLNKGTYYLRIESGKRSTQQILIKE